MKNNMTVKEVATRLNTSQTFVREGLARDKFPFGFGIKTKDKNKKRTFFINRELFEKYLEGDIKHGL